LSDFSNFYAVDDPSENGAVDWPSRMKALSWKALENPETGPFSSRDSFMH